MNENIIKVLTAAYHLQHDLAAIYERDGEEDWGRIYRHTAAELSWVIHLLSSEEAVKEYAEIYKVELDA